MYSSLKLKLGAVGVGSQESMSWLGLATGINRREGLGSGYHLCTKSFLSEEFSLRGTKIPKVVAKVEVCVAEDWRVRSRSWTHLPDGVGLSEFERSEKVRRLYEKTRRKKGSPVFLASPPVYDI